jgi:hypothetical protein
VKREPGKLETFLSIVALLMVVYPEAFEPRVWCYIAMKASREGARRCGQLAILAERHYRRESA